MIQARSAVLRLARAQRTKCARRSNAARLAFAIVGQNQHLRVMQRRMMHRGRAHLMTHREGQNAHISKDHAALYHLTGMGYDLIKRPMRAG